MAHETSIIRAWLFDTLNGDDNLRAALTEGITDADNAPPRIWHDLAAQGAPMPYVICGLQSSVDDNSAGARVNSNNRFSVKIVSKTGEHEPASNAALDRIDVLLQNAKFNQDGAYFTVSGAGALPEFTEVATGAREYSHRGRSWRFIVAY